MTAERAVEYRKEKFGLDSNMATKRIAYLSNMGHTDTGFTLSEACYLLLQKGKEVRFENDVLSSSLV